MGAAFGGARALAVMKHVGVNVAADPLFTLSYTGLRGGLVLVTADDPEMHSSQNEQDNRHYARFAKVPMLEPSDSQEAKDYTRIAYELSEKFDTPVMLRTTTRVSHSKSIVRQAEPIIPPVKPGLVKDPVKLVMLRRMPAGATRWWKSGWKTWPVSRRPFRKTGLSGGTKKSESSPAASPTTTPRRSCPRLLS